ncbi:G protein-activated inward rectifier potassium channel 3-like [Anneissia japonica]|uniref:G protein-activated inward rectifier potassium channel 3-like n=1 Tax=Anneissia japonica TaxID=1529436 RepID=UPI0014257CAE|nr:G protein-activated inward rectifier potassium channel 3-like [Anneissia japonica]
MKKVASFSDRCSIQSYTSSSEEDPLKKRQATTPTAQMRRRKSLMNIVKQVSWKKGRHLQRLVEKNGDCNVIHRNVKRRKMDLVSDLFTTFVEMRWRWLLFLFTIGYLIGWVGFAGFWFAISYYNGDLGYLTDNPEHKPCVANVDSFETAFLFSLETQTTIGYGLRVVTPHCWMGFVLVIVQSVFSCLVDGILIGCIFAKLARPKKRAVTLKFSKYSCIAERDGQLCFMFRIGDIRSSHLYGVTIRAQLMRPRITQEGECIPLYSYELDLKSKTNDNNLLLVWPMIISHQIGPDSPLYDYSADELKNADFEIIIVLEGVVEQTGLLCQARTSYLPSEIKWGERFSSALMTLYDEWDCQFSVDYKQFNKMYTVSDMPICSAREYDEKRAQEREGLDLESLRGYQHKRLLDLKTQEAEKEYRHNGRQRSNGSIEIHEGKVGLASIESFEQLEQGNGNNYLRVSSRQSDV